MEKVYTKEEHDKCKRVADAFQELYAMYGDMCVLDAGDFGFVHLRWFRDGCFDGNTVYTDSRELFDDLWEMWMDYVLLDSVTPIQSVDKSSRLDDEFIAYSEIIRENLEMDLMYERYPFDRELLDGIYDLILETVLCQSGTVVVAKNEYPVQFVKS